MKRTHPAARLALFGALTLLAVLGGIPHLAFVTLLAATLALLAPPEPGTAPPTLIPRPLIAILIAASLALTVAINAYLVPGEASGLLPGASREGLAFGGLLAWRLGALYVLLAAQTRWLPYRELLSVVVRLPGVGLPLGLAARFVPEVATQGQRLAAAQRARGLHEKTTGAHRRALAVPLFVSTLRRAEQVATALELSGHGAGRPTRLPRWAWGPLEWLLLAASLALLATLLPAFNLA